jgi:molybdopterin-containing oxidoreductase family membrane subunit
VGDPVQLRLLLPAVLEGDVRELLCPLAPDPDGADAESDWTITELRINGIVTLVLALGVTSIAGVVYGSQSFRPFWASGDIPVAFIFESLLGGLAFIFFFTYLAYAFNPAALPGGVKRLFTGPLPRLLALAIFVHLLFVLARMASGLYGNLEGLQVWHHVATSPLFYAEVLIGLVLPLVLLMRPGTRNNPWVQILAAFLVMNALLVSRYEYILGGQLVPMFKGAWAPALLSYVPSPTEWLMLLVAIFLSNTFNALGELFLGLSREGNPSAQAESEPMGVEWGEGAERLAS